MSIVFRCPNCGKRLRADDKRAGRTAICSRCASGVKIPMESEAGAERGSDDGEAPAEKPPSDHPLLLFRRSDKHPEDLIDMTAMVDIVFFLLIFFMVTSMQAIESVIGLPTPQAQASSS